MKKILRIFKVVFECVWKTVLFIWGYIKPFINFIAFLFKKGKNFNSIPINHVVYGILWVFAAISLTSPECFGKLFDSIIKKDDFGIIGSPAIKEILQLFAIITLLLHQAFIYQSLHEMEHEPATFETEYKGWFGKPLEWILRVLVLFLLLAGVGKVYFLIDFVKYFYGGKNEFEAQINLIVSASVLLFLILTTWNTFAGCKCSNWKYWKSDFMALLFWASIIVIANKLENYLPILKYLPILLVLIVLLYFEVIFKRLYNYLVNKIPNSLN